MKILALYPFLPYPAFSGAKIRGSMILDILVQQHKVVLASFIAKDDVPARLPEWQTATQLAQPAITVVRRSEEVLSAAGLNLRARRPTAWLGMPNCLAAFDAAAMWNRLAELDFRGIDAVHVRYLSMAPYALALKKAAPHLRLVIDLDDIVSLLLLRKLKYPRDLAQLRMFLWESKELLRTYCFERGPLRAFDSIWICSAKDRNRMAARVSRDHLLVVENVVHASRLARVNRGDLEPALLFVGDFNYLPNRAGADFFVRKAWPLVRSRVPSAQLWLVGVNSQPDILGWNGKDGIVVTGAVDDVGVYLQRAMVSIAPLFAGSGTRLKILEALGVGLPVVTTTMGVEGIDARNGVELLVADDARDFANHCIRLLEDAAFRAELVKAGQCLVRERYDASVMKRAVLACYEQIGTRRMNGSTEPSGLSREDASVVP